MAQADRDRVLDAAEAAFCRSAVKGLMSAAAEGAGIHRRLVHRLFGTGRNLAFEVLLRAADRQREGGTTGVIADPRAGRAALVVSLRHQHVDDDFAVQALRWLLAVRVSAKVHAPGRVRAAEAEAVGRLVLSRG